jgi:four helix bundle protein
MFGRHIQITSQVPQFCDGATGMGQSYRDLIVWQRAMLLVKETYRVTKTFPRDELYGLTSQLRRASVSVPSNIAEGQARLSRKEFHHFLTQARGSLAELETQIQIAKDLDYVSQYDVGTMMRLSAETGQLLNRLMTSIKVAV